MELYDESWLPELNWISMYSWATGLGRYDHALCYLAVFWPDFKVYEECVFRSQPSPEAFREWMQQVSGDTSKVEAALNHIHLVGLFHNSEFKPDGAFLMHFGQIMKQMWSCKLNQDFPNRRFEVLLSGDVNDIVSITITFFHEKNEE